MSISKYILKTYYRLIGMTPDKMPMVKWWKTAEKVEAIVTKDKSGADMMVPEGEKYPILSFPRSHILVPEHHTKEEAVTLEDRIKKHGAFSVLKHEIKNQVFNENWKKLENGEPVDIVESLRNITKYLEPLKYDLMPPESMCQAVREIHRAWTKAVPGGLSYRLRDILTFIMQEDDSYKYRTQHLAEWFNPNVWYKRVFWFLTGKSYLEGIKMQFDYALGIMEHCEILSDMHERLRLLRKILMVALEDKKVAESFEKFCKKLKWKKIYLTKGDRYHVRGKYYRPDYGMIEY